MFTWTDADGDEARLLAVAEAGDYGDVPKGAVAILEVPEAVWLDHSDIGPLIAELQRLQDAS